MTESPTSSPSGKPTLSPTNTPTVNFGVGEVAGVVEGISNVGEIYVCYKAPPPPPPPSRSPSVSPSKGPTMSPTVSPSRSPTASPTTGKPTVSPSMSPLTTIDVSFNWFGSGECLDSKNRKYSSLLVMSREVTIETANDCGLWCLNSSPTDLFRGIAYSRRDDEASLCFCYYDKDAAPPDGFFSSTSDGEGPVSGTNGLPDFECFKFDPVVPSSSPTLGPTTASPTLLPTKATQYSDSLYTFVGIGVCQSKSDLGFVSSTIMEEDSIDLCANRCTRVGEKQEILLGFNYDPSKSECVCHWDVSGLQVSGGIGEIALPTGTGGQICFRFIAVSPCTFW